MTEYERGDEKAFVLLSGGIDSAVCLQEALENHEEVEAIHVDYGQQTEHIERSNAEAQAEEYGIELHQVDYRDVFGHFAEGTTEDKEYDRDNLTEDDHSVGFVPQRNAHLITTATAIAEHNTEVGTDIAVYHGAQGGDEEDYPDCRPEFMGSLEDTLNRGTDQHEIYVEAPINTMSKEEVLEYGEELGVNWEHTFSCYNDEDGDACGGCPACVERIDAFEDVDFEDPVMEDVEV